MTNYKLLLCDTDPHRYHLFREEMSVTERVLDTLELTSFLMTYQLRVPYGDFFNSLVPAWDRLQENGKIGDTEEFDV